MGGGRVDSDATERIASCENDGFEAQEKQEVPSHRFAGTKAQSSTQTQLDPLPS